MMITQPIYILKQIASAWHTQVRAVVDKLNLFTLLTWQPALPHPHKHVRKWKLTITLMGLVLILVLGQPLPTHAANMIIVDGVNCTLAEAITSANKDNAEGNGCADGSGADIIVLGTDVILSEDLPTITSEITLQGKDNLINGVDKFRMLRNFGTLIVNDTTIFGGVGAIGGGIENWGTLTVNNSIVLGNRASLGGGIHNNGGNVTVNYSTLSTNTGVVYGGGIFNNHGTVTVNHSAIIGNVSLGNDESFLGGGGIFNLGGTVTLNYSTLGRNQAALLGGGITNVGDTLNLNFSTVSSNTAVFGGGIANFGTTSDGVIVNGGTVNLNNSTLSGNEARSAGGGIYNFGMLEMNNSTLSGNKAPALGGGIYNLNAANLNMNNSTLTGNQATLGSGGGIFNLAKVNLKRSLISGNVARIEAAEVYNAGTVNAANYNVVGHDGKTFSYRLELGYSDIVPTGALQTVLNTTLANNGGPTWTHALVQWSVAIDLALSADCAAPPINGVDQRGAARNVDGNGVPATNHECDTGAFEFASNTRP